MRWIESVDACTRRAIVVSVLAAGCRTVAPPEQPPTDSPSASADAAELASKPTAPPPLHETLPTTLEECTLYVEGYCTPYGSEDDGGEQRAYEELDRSERERVLLECERSLHGVSDSNRETFIRCLGCLQDCSDAHKCLGRERGGMVLFFDDCPDEDAT
jgi:hypothetical protein